MIDYEIWAAISIQPITQLELRAKYRKMQKWSAAAAFCHRFDLYFDNGHFFFLHVTELQFFCFLMLHLLLVAPLGCFAI